MIVVRPNPSYVALTVVALNPDGSMKLDVVSGTVRVYCVGSGGSEVNYLVPTPLVQVGATSAWRYMWHPVSLAEGIYTAEFILTDALAVASIGTDDISVTDYATGAALSLAASDIAILKQIGTGRYQIVGNQLILYAADDSPMYTFDLLDENGNPSMDAVFERVPA